MKKLIKWAFIEPILLLILWILGFFLPNFRQMFIDAIKYLLNKESEKLDAKYN